MSAASLRDLIEHFGDARDDGDWPRFLELLRVHWSELFQEHPDDLLDLLVSVPPDVLEANSRLRFAEEYLRRILHRPAAERAVDVGDSAMQDPVDLLAEVTNDVRLARMEGRYLDAVAAAERAVALLRDTPAHIVPTFDTALTEFHYHWALAFQLVNQFDMAAEQFALSYDWAGTVGNHMAAARAAGAVALIHALHGRGREATAWLLKRPRIPDDAWWAAAARTPGTLAEAILYLERLEVDAARVVLLGVDIREGLDYWAPYFAVRAYITPDDETTARALLAEFDAFVGTLTDEHAYNPLGSEFAVFSRSLLLRLTGRADEAERMLGAAPVDAGSSLVRQMQAVVHARMLVRRDRAVEAARVIAPLLHVSSARPRILVAALLIAADRVEGEERAEMLRRVADLSAWNLCHQSWAFASAEVRAVLAADARERGDGEIADRLEALAGGATIAGSDALTHREAAVVQAALAGLTNSEISEAHHVSINTVKTHLRHAYTKLGVTSREELQWLFQIDRLRR